MMFNATFNNISVMLWQSVLLVEESGVPGENHRPDASHWKTLSHYVVSDDKETYYIKKEIYKYRVEEFPFTLKCRNFQPEFLLYISIFILPDSQVTFDFYNTFTWIFFHVYIVHFIH